jgi:hypothetical protein
MTAKWNPHAEVGARISNTTVVLGKLDLFWKRAPVSTVWKLRVYDAVITSKLLYGLESASLTKPDFARLYSFQMKALRNMLGVPQSYHSREPNEEVMGHLIRAGGETSRKSVL